MICKKKNRIRPAVEDRNFTKAWFLLAAAIPRDRKFQSTTAVSTKNNCVSITTHLILTFSDNKMGLNMRDLLF